MLAEAANHSPSYEADVAFKCAKQLRDEGTEGSWNILCIGEVLSLFQKLFIPASKDQTLSWSRADYRRG